MRGVGECCIYGACGSAVSLERETLMPYIGLRPKSLTQSTNKYLYYAMVVRRCCCCCCARWCRVSWPFSSILYPRHSLVAPSDLVYLDPCLPSFTHLLTDLLTDLLTETSRSLLAHSCVSKTFEMNVMIPCILSLSVSYVCSFEMLFQCLYYSKPVKAVCR